MNQMVRMVAPVLRGRQRFQPVPANGRLACFFPFETFSLNPRRKLLHLMQQLNFTQRDGAG
jgi:hypothetical protein